MNNSVDLLPEKYLLRRKMIRAGTLWFGVLVLFVWVMFLAVRVSNMRADGVDKNVETVRQREKAAEVLVVRDRLMEVMKQLQVDQAREKEQISLNEDLLGYWTGHEWETLLQKVAEAAPEGVWVLKLEVLPVAVDGAELACAMGVSISGKARSASMVHVFVERLGELEVLGAVELKLLGKSDQIDEKTWTVFEVAGRME